jgi:hypothetical protein
MVPSVTHDDGCTTRGEIRMTDDEERSQQDVLELRNRGARAKAIVEETTASFVEDIVRDVRQPSQPRQDGPARGPRSTEGMKESA